MGSQTTLGEHAVDDEARMIEVGRDADRPGDTPRSDSYAHQDVAHGVAFDRHVLAAPAESLDVVDDKMLRKRCRRQREHVGKDASIKRDGCRGSHRGNSRANIRAPSANAGCCANTPVACALGSDSRDTLETVSYR